MPENGVPVRAGRKRKLCVYVLNARQRGVRHSSAASLAISSTEPTEYPAEAKRQSGYSPIKSSSG